MALRIWTIGIGLTAVALGVAAIRYAVSASEAIKVSIAGF
jgi:hypothetical protein